MRLSNLGTLLASRGRFVEAADAAARAQGLAPESADIANNHAIVLQQGGRAAEAVEIYRQALALDPLHADAWANLGVVLQELFRFDDAIEALQRCVDLKPEFDSAIVELVKLRRHVCDWSRFDEDHRSLLGLIGRETGAIFMLLLMSFPTTPSSNSRVRASTCGG